MQNTCTQTVAAAEYNKTNTVPTSYVNADVLFKTELPEGYERANYTVKLNGLPYYENKTPTEKDMTKEAAAELVAQYLWQVYEANLEGQTIILGYHIPTDNTPRPMWTAEVEMEGRDYRDGYRVDGYGAWIDSVTGDLLHIYMNRTLEEKVKVGSMTSPDEDPSKYEPAAEKLAEKYNVVHGDIESINYTGQGFRIPTNPPGIYGDPTISFEIHGKNGEVAHMSFSRYDEVLEDITYNGQYKYTLLRVEEQRQKAQEAQDRSA